MLKTQSGLGRREARDAPVFCFALEPRSPHTRPSGTLSPVGASGKNGHAVPGKLGRLRYVVALAPTGERDRVRGQRNLGARLTS